MPTLTKMQTIYKDAAVAAAQMAGHYAGDAQVFPRFQSEYPDSEISSHHVAVISLVGMTQIAEADVETIGLRLQNPNVNYIVMPLSVPYFDKQTGERYPAGDHWNAFVLVRTADGFKALHLEIPSDGQCGFRVFDMAKELVDHGLDAFRRGEYARRLQPLTADGLSESILADVAQLRSIEVGLFDAESLVPIAPVAAARRKVTFGADQVKEFDKDAPAASVAKVAREEAGFAPTPVVTFDQQLAEAKVDYDAMEAVKDQVSARLKARFKDDLQGKAQLFEIYTKALNLEPTHQEFLARIEFSTENYDRKIDCLAKSAAINPDFKAWFDRVINAPKKVHPRLAALGGSSRLHASAQPCAAAAKPAGVAEAREPELVF